MQRWLIGILILLVAVVLIAVGAIHWVMSGDLPRQWVLEAAQRQTGLRIEAATLRPTWSGMTSIESATIALPLEDEPFITVPRIEVQHNGILSMLIRGGGVTIESIHIEQPRLIALRHDDGRWNWQDAADLLAAHADATAEPAAIPRIAINNARITIEADGETVDIAPVTLKGEPLGAVAWQFEATLAEHGRAAGRFATSGATSHELTIDVTPGERLAGMLWPDAPTPLALEATWTGEVEDGTLHGRLDVARGLAGRYEVVGGARLALHDEQIAIEPLALRITGIERVDGPLHVDGGSAVVDGDTLRFDAVNLAVDATAMKVTGDWSLATQTGDISTAWTSRWPLAKAGSGDNGAAARIIEQEGSLTASVKRAAAHFDERTIDIRLATRGRSPWGDWTAVIEGNGRGADWRQMQWQVSMPTMRLKPMDRDAIDLAKATLAVALDWPTIAVTRFALASPSEVTGEARYNVESRKWLVKLAAPALQPPGLNLPPIRLLADLAGEGDRATINAFYAQVDRLQLGIRDGSYDPRRQGQPFIAQVTATYSLNGLAQAADASPAPPTPTTDDGAATKPQKEDTAAPAAPQPATQPLPQWAGRLRWTGEVRGDPRALTFTGKGMLAGDGIVINHQTLESLTIPTELALAGGTLQIESQRVGFLDGSMALAAAHELGALETLVDLDARDVSLARVARYANREAEVAGTWSGTLHVTLPHEQLREMHVTGDITVDNFKAGAIAFDRMEGKLATRRSIMRFDPVTLTYGGGRAEGKATFNLRSARTIEAQLRSTDWPVASDDLGLRALVDGEADLRIDVISRSVLGDLSLQTRVLRDEEQIALLDLDGKLDSQRLHFRSVGGRLFGATVAGQANVDLVTWEKSTGELTCEGLALADLAQQWIPDETVRGRLSGVLSFGPADDKRALEPMRIDLSLTGDGVAVHGVDFAGGHITAFAGPRRIVVADSHFGMAGGSTQAWASFTRRDDAWHAHLRSDFERLDLATLKAAIHPQGDPIVGRVAGHVTYVGDIHDWQRAIGRGSFDLSQADLSDTDIIESVFDTIGLLAASREPNGYGTARVRLEDAKVIIDQFDYFNRGVQINLRGEIADVRMGLESPVLIYAGGTLRPLKHVDLPGAKTIDEFITNLQSTVTTIRAAGTLGDPRPAPVPLSEASRTLRDLLGNDTGPKAGEAAPQ